MEAATVDTILPAMPFRKKLRSVSSKSCAPKPWAPNADPKTFGAQSSNALTRPLVTTGGPKRTDKHTLECEDQPAQAITRQEAETSTLRASHAHRRRVSSASCCLQAARE